MKALLIIDMQIGSFKPYSIRYNTLQKIEQINLLSRKFRDAGYPVIYIKHDGTKEEYLLPQTEDFEILPELIQEPSDIVVVKEANDAFYNTELLSTLIGKNIDELYFCGCATDFCVDATIKTALVNDFKIYIASNAHTTASRPQVDAPTIIEYYNWLWSNMTPTKHNISVCSTQDIISSLEV
ncbi:isochorismatase family protein [Dysgonomonas sp. ZJ279]|uniref:isochorismatase family protein n=1 Tax=Dysgonomonas sp. ZJ279 TaxID=2709796 RepID=UPI0013EAD20A|nr:isochorismatase family protein [Dysgonomonas sp. ZJ279]